MRMYGPKRRLINLKRNPLLACSVVFAFFLSFSIGPSIDFTVAMDQAEMSVSQTSGMDHAMNGMDGPCCEDCEDNDAGACSDTALCQSACGKLPAQIGAYIKVYSLVQSDVSAFADTGIWDGRSLSPPRRPPKLA